MAITDRDDKRNLFWRLGNVPQPFSPMSVAKHSRLQGATPFDSVCPYCTVRCAQQLWVKNGESIDIEGDPRSPINEDTLCPRAPIRCSPSTPAGPRPACTAPPAATTGKRNRWTG